MNLLVDLKDAYSKVGLNVEGAAISSDDISLTLTAEVYGSSPKESVLIKNNLLRVHLKSVGEKLQENLDLKKILADALGLSESAVLIDNGQRSKLKRVVLNYQLTPDRSAVYFKDKIKSLC